MGLGAAKKRLKLSQDPNNTAWSRSTTTFGHKILTSQGWAPGEYLGAKNASHSGHYTAANASHIRAVLREDNLGLGAKIGSGNADNFGLSMLSGLLGRLNGKSDEVLQKQEAAMRDVELRTYQAQKHGYMNFVSGGFLVGDKMESSSEQTNAVRRNEEVTVDRKRKRDEDSEAAAVQADLSAANKKQKKKEKKSKAKLLDVSSGGEISSTDANVDVTDEDEDKSRRRRERAERKAEKAKNTHKADSALSEKAQLKAEKRARKEERRKRKEEKRQKRVAAGNETAPTSSGISSGTSTPIDSDTLSGLVANAAPSLARHAVRQRYIQQKRMASMNAQALKEIFMIQAAS